MERLILLALFGFGAQLVDGSLGMAYGVTSTTLLVAYGIAPAIASASVHLAETGTTLASGLAHWRLGNVNWRAVGLLALPGAVGAFFGAVVLSNIAAELAEPWVAGFLLILGVYLLVRFTFGKRITFGGRPLSAVLLSPLGLFAGFLDAAGGGGWGPIATPTLLATGRMQPRHVVGTVDTSEFLVALAASVGFLYSLGAAGLDFELVGAFLVGGVVAAPLAAWLVRHLNPRILGAAVGGLIILTNIRTLMRSADIEPDIQTLVFLGVAAIWIAAVVLAVRALRSDRETGAAGEGHILTSAE